MILTLVGIHAAMLPQVQDKIADSSTESEKLHDPPATGHSY